MQIIFIAFSFILSSVAWSQDKIALVKMLRGDVTIVLTNKTSKLKVGDWVPKGGKIVTKERSFVKLVFTDKSQLNIGPNSEMKVERFDAKDSGIIDLVRGKIRSQITKDYLQIQDKSKSKLFIKTQNAVMGVRGTDFIISSQNNHTTTILFEGEIVFNKLNIQERRTLSTTRLEQIVERGVHLYPGEFSVVERSRPLPTIPALLNIHQKEKLEKDLNIGSERSPSQVNDKSQKKVVPEGLDGKMVSNDSKVLINEIDKSTSSFGDNSKIEEVTKELDIKGKDQVISSSVNPDGYIDGEKIKPINGSKVIIETGEILSPGKEAVFDAFSNTYVSNGEASTIAGSANFTGDLQQKSPPRVELDSSFYSNQTNLNGGFQPPNSQPIFQAPNTTITITPPGQ